MKMRTTLALILLLTCTGLSAEEYPFEMKGFYPDMPETEFDALAESYGSIDESSLGSSKYHFFSECVVTEAEHYPAGSWGRERAVGQKESCHKSEMSKFTLGGQPVYSVDQSYSEAGFVRTITFKLHTGDTKKYVERLEELFTEKYGLPQNENDLGSTWRIDTERYIDTVQLWRRTSNLGIYASIVLNRINHAAREEQKQSEWKSDLEDL